MPYHILKTRFDSLRRRANARNVSFRISLRWLIHIINPFDETKLSCYTSHRRSTTVSLETYPSISSRDQGPVSRKTRKLFGPVKPFFVHLYLKTEKCTSLKLLVRSEPLFILKNMWIKQLWNRKVRDFSSALRARKVSGAFEKRPLSRVVQSPIILT